MNCFVSEFFAFCMVVYETLISIARVDGKIFEIFSEKPIGHSGRFPNR